MIANVALFALAAFFEIAGCFAFWVWLRRGGTPVVALVGIASLMPLHGRVCSEVVSCRGCGVVHGIH